MIFALSSICLCLLTVVARILTENTRLRLFDRFYYVIIFAQLASEIYELTQINSQRVLLLVHCSVIVSIVLMFFELYRIEKLRARAPKALTQVVDMILLPTTYGCLITHSLRLLLEKAEIHVIVSTIDSADIWESWALWSVLKLFCASTKFQVESPSSEFLIHGRSTTFVRQYERFCLNFVQIYVFVNFLVKLTEILVKGLVSEKFPSLCSFLAKECLNCVELYDLYASPYLSTCCYILCCLSILCILLFQRTFELELSQLEPYWKFFGVKALVSVTYFQFFILKNFLFSKIRDAYFYYCVICAIEIPLLSLIHIFLAYPMLPHKRWVRFLLTSLEEEPRPPTTRFQKLRNLCLSFLFCLIVYFGAKRLKIPVYELSCPETARKLPHADFKKKLGLCETKISQCHVGYRGEVRILCRPEFSLQISDSCRRIGCGAPPSVDNAIFQVNNKTSWYPDDVVKYRCLPGYHGNPKAVCEKSGKFRLTNPTCVLTGCRNLFPSIPNAEIQHDNRTATYVGDTRDYACSPGYEGHPSATCTEFGTWHVSGDSCILAKTAYGCECKPSYEYCQGFFSSKCSTVHGCVREGFRYSWCRLEKTSKCGVRIFSWDYCVKN